MESILESKWTRYGVVGICLALIALLGVMVNESFKFADKFLQAQTDFGQGIRMDIKEHLALSRVAQSRQADASTRGALALEGVKAGIDNLQTSSRAEVKLSEDNNRMLSINNGLMERTVGWGKMNNEVLIDNTKILKENSSKLERISDKMERISEKMTESGLDSRSQSSTIQKK